MIVDRYNRPEAYAHYKRIREGPSYRMAIMLEELNAEREPALCQLEGGERNSIQGGLPPMSVTRSSPESPSLAGSRMTVNLTLDKKALELQKRLSLLESQVKGLIVSKKNGTTKYIYNTINSSETFNKGVSRD